MLSTNGNKSCKYFLIRQPRMQWNEKLNPFSWIINLKILYYYYNQETCMSNLLKLVTHVFSFSFFSPLQHISETQLISSHNSAKPVCKNLVLSEKNRKWAWCTINKIKQNKNYKEIEIVVADGPLIWACFIHNKEEHMMIL